MSTENVSKKKRSPLIYVLLPLLIVMIVALIIDRNARRQCSAAFDTVDAFMGPSDDSAIGSNLGTKTREDVYQAIGKDPVKMDELAEDRFPLDHFRWRGGLPWRTYDLFVVYNEGNIATLYSYADNREGLKLPLPSIGPPSADAAAEEFAEEPMEDPEEETEDPIEEPMEEPVDNIDEETGDEVADPSVEDSADESSSSPGPELGPADGEDDTEM